MVPISLTEIKKHERLLDYFFNICDNFYVVYPNGDAHNTDILENPLLVGKEDFLNLKDIVITPWDGMKNSIKISGCLNKDVIKIFRHYLFERGDAIWKYSFLIDEKEVIEINDFNDGILDISETEFNTLRKNKILNEDAIIPQWTHF